MARIVVIGAGTAGLAVLLVGDAAHTMRPHLGRGGCQGLDDAAILGAFVERTSDLPTVFARFAAFRRMVNLRPAFVSAVACRARALVPEALFTHHLAAVASASAFRLPTQA